MNEGRLDFESDAGGDAVVRLSGRLNNATVPPLWKQAEQAWAEGAPDRLVLDASGVTYLDGAGLALLMRLQCQAKTIGARVEVRGLTPGYQRLLNRFDPAEYHELERVKPKCESLPEQVGRVTARLWSDFHVQVEFVGELFDALVRALLRPGSVRWRDMWLAAERAGADALPIVALISGLVGLVLAFQSAMAMRHYGAEIYVANLVTIAVLRELGPLMTAIILAGRSGGAFAAEIGTMKVNDEVAALTTMGLRPVPFLAVPRVLGLVILIPFLTVFADVVGVLGGAAMFLSLDYPFSTYFDQAVGAAEVRHLVSGLIKSVAFGFTIAGVGCLRGLQTLRGPSAVGQSTTSAVVTSILLIVVIDAVFGTVFYVLKY